MSLPSDLFCDLAMPGVRALQPYQPGKPIEELQREYGVTDIVKLASNENPLGPSPKALAAAQAALTEIHRYPDGSGFALRQALAAHHDIDPLCITMGSGSNDLLEMVARAFLGPGREAVFAVHAFAIYAIASQAVGATLVAVPANPADHEQPYGHDLEAMRAAITPNTRVVFIANPNNPTGTWLTADELERFFDSVPRDVVIVLDEAYVEYAVDAAGYREGADWVRRYPNLLVTRTFSKAQGLAGLRVGYGLSSPELADLLNRVRMPFNVSLPAQAAAIAALADNEHIQASVRLNREEMERLCQRLQGMGLSWLPSAGNFLCLKVGPRAAEIYDALLRRGVIVRPVGGGYRLPDFLRVSIGLPRENDKFIQALTALQEQGLLQTS
ncbi:MAG TPA: histidinol-phosphate transaminase [Gammaproteobacteria bacterium]|nr:histidinol-phosphate transaminase [Gammaproteobacteria bacterium]